MNDDSTWLACTIIMIFVVLTFIAVLATNNQVRDIQERLEAMDAATEQPILVQIVKDNV